MSSTSSRSPSQFADKINLCLQTPGCLAFWSFDKSLHSLGPHSYELREISPSWEWVQAGVFGDHCVRIKPGGGFRIPRSELGDLNIHGPDAAVTVCAWIKRESTSFWQALAGVWDESRSKRQYYLFLNARSRTLNGTTRREACENRLHGHISDVGGPTPGLECCVTYATGATEVPMDTWCLAAMSYEKGTIRVYFDGRLDACDESNPFDGPARIFDGGREGADFTVGTNSVRREWSNPFGGLFGGLAVYNRALKDEELQKLASGL